MDMPFPFQNPPTAPPAPQTQTGQAPKGTEGEDPGTGQRPDGGNMMVFMFPMIIIFVLLYFMMIRPQRREQKKREELISKIKKNDHVLTTGGIYGIVDRLKDDDVFLKIDEKHDVRIRVKRTAIVGVEKVSGPEGEAKPESKEEAKKS